MKAELHTSVRPEHYSFNQILCSCVFNFACFAKFLSNKNNFEDFHFHFDFFVLFCFVLCMSTEFLIERSPHCPLILFDRFHMWLQIHFTTIEKKE